MKRKGSVGLALVLGSSLLLGGCGSTKTEQDEIAEIVVDMQQAQVGSLTLQNSFVGNVSPQEQVYVIPFASGTVTEVNYNVGDYVNAGDVLFRIDDEGAQLQLRQAELTALSTNQQIAMANGSQQKSADLQLESAQIQAQSGFDQAEMAYVQVKDAQEKLENAIEQAEDGVEALERQLTATVSSGNAAAAAQVQEQLTQTRATLSELQSQEKSMKSQRQQAESAYRAAESGLDISKQSKDLTQGEMRQDAKEQSNTSLAMAQLGLESAQLAYSYYTVTAPISGVIQSKNVETNGLASTGTPAFTIANENSMTVTFQVSETVKNTLEIGQSITVERQNQEFTGNITEIGVAVNQQTGLFQIKANVQADGNVLPNGVSVKITADTYEAADRILIPYDAVYYDNEGAYVYLCVDGLAAKRYVVTDIFNDTTIAIIDGITAGDTVITSWSPRLLDGVEVVASDKVTE